MRSSRLSFPTPPPNASLCAFSRNGAASEWCRSGADARVGRDSFRRARRRARRPREAARRARRRAPPRPRTSPPVAPRAPNRSPYRFRAPRCSASRRFLFLRGSPSAPLFASLDARRLVLRLARVARAFPATRPAAPGAPRRRARRARWRRSARSPSSRPARSRRRARQAAGNATAGTGVGTRVRRLLSGGGRLRHSGGRPGMT